MASLTTPRVSLVSGGAACVVAVGLVCAAFPAFTAYVSARAAARGKAGSGKASPGRAWREADRAGNAAGGEA